MRRPSEIQIRVLKAEILKSKVSTSRIAFLRIAEIITIHGNCR
jgi:C4-type Zn-finger protein